MFRVLCAYNLRVWNGVRFFHVLRIPRKSESTQLGPEFKWGKLLPICDIVRERATDDAFFAPDLRDFPTDLLKL